MEEYRVFGPPGTGKTSYLTAQIESALKKYWPEDILVASFTRAGAYTVAARTDAIPRDNIGTLHAFAFRAMGQPKIAEGHIKEFNETHPEWAIGYDDQNGDVDDPFTVVDTKNNAMMQYQTLRAKMIRREEWPLDVAQFAKVWEEWRDEHEYTDLTGLIEFAINYIDAAPGNPRVGFFDESQDFTRLEMTLVDKWAKDMDKIIKVGDDDQMIYSFKGATADSFNGNIDKNFKRYLKQSYRLPQEIVNYAAAWIAQLPDREPKPFFSERDGGQIKKLMATYKMTNAILDEVEALNEKGHTTMIITSCGYMLDPLKAAMFDRGIPWHNPYKPKRGDWNPLAMKRGRGVSSLQKLADWITKGYFDPYIPTERPLYGMDSKPALTSEQWAGVLEMIDTKAQGFTRGHKAALKKVKDGTMSLENWFLNYGPENYSAGEEFAFYLFNPTMEWLEKSLTPEKQKSFRLAFKMLGNDLNVNKLIEKPKNIIGTIHSIKGGEADYVFLCPDLSIETVRQATLDREARDAITRLYYVGMTRARHGLYLLQPATYYNVQLPNPE